MYKKCPALNNLQELICHKIQLYQTNLMECLEKKRDGNYTIMLRTLFSFRGKYFTEEQLHGHLLLISQTIQKRKVRHTG